MPLYKSAQLNPENEVIIYEEQPRAEDVIEMHEPEGFSFNFPHIPEAGGIEVSEDLGSESGGKETKEKGPKDPWDWQAGGMSNLMNWVQDRLNHIPDMSGNETTAIERAMSYLQKLNGLISKAISSDYNGEIDVKTMEVARKWIFTAIKTLEETLDKIHETHYKKKKSAGEDGEGMIKEARTPYTGGIVVTVPILISTVARSLINGQVSAGKDLTAMYKHQVKRFGLDMREQASLIQHLQDMGLPIMVDRFYLPDEEVPIRDNVDGEFSSLYSA